VKEEEKLLHSSGKRSSLEARNPQGGPFPLRAPRAVVCDSPPVRGASGLLQSRLFKYFRSKDKLALYLFKQCYERVTDELHEALQLERPFHDNLQALLGAYRRIVEEDLEAFHYATENTPRFWPSLSPELRERSLGGLVRQVFENGKAEGVVGRDADPELLVVGLVSQFASLLYFGEFQGPAGNWIASMERMIIKMCA